MQIFSRELDNPGINDVIGSIDIFHVMLGSRAISFRGGRGRGKEGDGVHTAWRMLGGKITVGDRRSGRKRGGGKGVRREARLCRGKKLAVRVFHATTVHPPSIFGKPINLPRPLQSGRGFRWRCRLANA